MRCVLIIVCCSPTEQCLRGPVIMCCEAVTHRRGTESTACIPPPSPHTYPLPSACRCRSWQTQPPPTPPGTYTPARYYRTQHSARASWTHTHTHGYTHAHRVTHTHTHGYTHTHTHTHTGLHTHSHQNNSVYLRTVTRLQAGYHYLSSLHVLLYPGQRSFDMHRIKHWYNRYFIMMNSCLKIIPHIARTINVTLNID